MLIAKHLPSAKDARIYMSVERTYLGYIRLSLYTLSFAVFLRKLEILADITQKIHVSIFLENVAVVLSIVGTFLIIVGILTFYFDIRYIEGGAKQLLICVQKYIIAVQHDNKTLECKKEE